MALSKTQVAKLYIAMFDRAPEKKGLDDWYQAAQDNEWGVADLANTMIAAAQQVVATDPAYASFYPQYVNVDTTDPASVRAIIETVYETLFNKTYQDDPEGIDTWVDNVVKNGQSLGEAIASITIVADQIANGEVEADAQTVAAAQAFENKVEVALYAAEHIPSADIDGDGKYDFQDFQNFIKNVTDDPATVNAAKAMVDEYTPKSVTLTTGKDTITGSKAADTFTAPILTLTDGDSIDGKEGIDTLSAEINSNVSSQVKISNVEKIDVTSYGNNQIDMTNITGATKVTTDNSTGTLSLVNIASTDTGLGLKGANQTINATYNDLTGGSDKLDLTLDNASQANVTVNAGFESADIHVSGSSSINNFANSPAQLTIDGDGSLTLNNVLPNAVSLFDASALSGAITTGRDIDNDGFVDTVRLNTAGAGAVVKLGKGANNVLINDGANVGTSNTIYGGDSADKIDLIKGAGGNVVFAGKGDDTVRINTASNGLTNSDVINTGDGTDTLIIANNNANSFVARGLENLNIKSTATQTNTVTSDSALNVTLEVGNAGTATNTDVRGLHSGSTVEVVNAQNQNAGANNITVAYAQPESSSTITVNAKVADAATNSVTVNNVKDLTLDFKDTVGGTNAIALNFQGSDSVTLKTAKAANFGAVADTAANDTLADLTANAQDALSLGNITSTVLKTVTATAEKALSVGTMTGGNALDKVTLTSNTASVNVGNMGTTQANIANGVSITAKTNVTAGTIIALKAGDITMNAQNGILTAAAITASQILGNVKLTSAGNLTAAAVDGAQISSITLTSSQGTVTGLDVANIAANAKVGDITVKGAGNVNVVGLGDGNDSFTNINVESTNGTVTLAGGVNAKDADGFNVNLKANSISGNITASTIQNTDGNIDSVILSTKGTATATVQVSDSGTTGGYYVKSVDASNVTGGATLTVTNADDQTTVSSSTTISLGAAASTTNNTVTVLGAVDTLTINGSKGNDSITIGDGADGGDADDTFKTATISLGTGNDSVDFTNYDAKDVNGNGLIINLSSSAQTVDGTTVSANHVIESDGNLDGTYNITNGTDIYMTGVESVTGTGNDDVIYGSAGADTLTGGAGADTLTGGAGADVFTYAVGDTAYSNTTTVATAEHITDFVSGTDQIDMPTAGSATNFATHDAEPAGGDANDNAPDVATALTVASVTSSDGIIYDYVYDSNGGTNAYLFVDWDDDGTVDDMIVLDGLDTAIAANDII